MKKILVAEDEQMIRELLCINLSRLGYEVVSAKDGAEVIEIFEKRKTDFDVVLLDVMMPKLSGIEVCRRIREVDDTTGIIFLSAKTQEDDKVCGLLSGGDDYITKPFSISELSARLEAVCRRVAQTRKFSSKQESDDIVSGDFLLSTKKRAVFKKEEKTELSQTEFEILFCLMSNAGKSIERKDILKAVWGEDFFGDEKVVDVNIRRLRLKIEDDASNPKHLVTVWGKGYKWLT